MNQKPKTRTERFELRLTPAEKERLYELAKEQELTVTDYIVRHLRLNTSH